MTYIGLDFEYANNHTASICAYGLAFEDGTKQHGFVKLHATTPLQERTRYHGVTQEETDGGVDFKKFYDEIATLTSDPSVRLVAHDLKSDRRAWLAALTLHELAPLPLVWVDSLPLARAEIGSSKIGGKAGIAAMAERYNLTITHHNPADDAFVSLQIALRNPPTKNLVHDGPAPKQRRRSKAS